MDSTFLRRCVARLKNRLRIGRAYDMARDLAAHLPRGARVLDVGCGSGYILLHLRGLVGAEVQGVDIMGSCEAPIAYTRFDGRHLPFPDQAFEAVLLCYVLHHASDPAGLLREVRRVLRPDGKLILYEDIPARWYDRLLCLKHELDWLSRSGACTFLSDPAWQGLLQVTGFALEDVRALSRWRDPSHPIGRCCYLARKLSVAP